jgi:DNA-binding MarR family transcriptional regulator
MKNSRKQAIPILATLNAVNKKFGKLYCYPNQLTIISLLGRYHDTIIAIATLNRWLKDLEDKGYIKRTRRIRKDKRRGIMFKSTLYKITILGYHALKMTGVSVWREIKALTVEGFKAGERALSKFTGPVAMKTVVSAMGMFPENHKTYLLEE